MKFFFPKDFSKIEIRHFFCPFLKIRKKSWKKNIKKSKDRIPLNRKNKYFKYKS
jgi:hypothetical protein